MKNVAIPIPQLRAKQARDAERKRLMEIDVIPAAKKQQRIDDINEKITAVLDKAKAARAKVEAQKKLTSEQKRDKIDEIGKAEDAAFWPLHEKYNDAVHVLTKEDKRTRLADLDRQDKVFSSAYGLQPHTPEEDQQRQQDAIAHQKYLDEEHYKHQRAMEYPSVGDQLDALWKHLHGRDDLDEDALVMMSKIADVKTKYPKPEKKNG